MMTITTHLGKVALTWAAAGFALTAVLASGMRADAQAIASHNTNAPVSFNAGNIALDDRANRVVLTGGGSQLTGLPELAKRALGKSVRLGRPRLLSGLPEDTGPSFATAIGLLLHSERPDAELPSLTQGRFLRTGTGYLARVGQWIRESF